MIVELFMCLFIIFVPGFMVCSIIYMNQKIGKWVDDNRENIDRHYAEKWAEGSIKMFKTHEILIYPEDYQPIINGVKRFEITYNDRDYKVGDYLLIRENTLTGYTGRYCICRILYIDNNLEYLKNGYSCLSIMLLNMFDNKKSDN